MHDFYELFDALDRDGDGRLTRQELYLVARELNWHQHQAPLYAMLDFLTIRTPLDRGEFAVCMAEAGRDIRGVFGQVLRRGFLGTKPPFIRGLSPEKESIRANPDSAGAQADRMLWDGSGAEGIVGLLREIVGRERSGEFPEALERSSTSSFTVRSGETALILIDPQRSFTCGDWMWRLGPIGEMEAMPIRLAFDNCARLLGAVYGRVEVMFSRCPFPPVSYGWDVALEEIVADDQLYFIKPGNNLLLPECNGYREWLQALTDAGIRTLVMGGCTLNSCLRVSAVATRNLIPPEQLDLVVDLSLCGARASNYLNADQFGGISPVEAAMREIKAGGVTVAQRVLWK